MLMNGWIRSHGKSWDRRFLLLALLAIATSNLWGQFAKKLPAPNAQRGFQAVGKFQETVNIFSGNVNIAIPLVTLKSDNEFVFRLTLYYDSNVWHVGPGEPYDRTSDLRPKPFDSFNALDPTAGAYSWNVSPGWLVHPGRIVEANPGISEGAHFFYMGADLSQIPLYDRLHGTDPDEPSGSDAYYSRDGKYLKFVSEGGPTGFLYQAGGVRTRFDGGWFVYSEDAYGNRVDKIMEFPDDPLEEVVMVFRENRYGREVRVGLNPSYVDCGPLGTCFNTNLGMVEWVEYQAPGLDQNNQPNRERIQFHRVPQVLINLPPLPEFCDVTSPKYDYDACLIWVAENIPIVDRPPFCDFNDPSYDMDQCTSWEAEEGIQRAEWRRHLAEIPPHPMCAPLDCYGRGDDFTMYAGGILAGQLGPLSAITFPDGSEYQFKYGLISEVDGGPEGMLSGAIYEMRLPTGGTVTYDYGEYRVPDNRRPDLRFTDDADCAENPQYCTDFWGPQMGVISRKFFDIGKDPATDPPDEETRYLRGVVDANNIGNQNFLDQSVVVNSGEISRRRDMFVVETSTLGDDTVHYFRTPEKAWDNGLSFTRHAAIQQAFPGQGGGDIRQAYLSQEQFEGPAVVNGQKGQLKRRTFVTYERDVKSADEDFENQLNARVKYQREVFADDLDTGGNPHYTETLYLDYDGYGHYRTVETGGTFTGGASKTVTTNFNPGTGNYVVFETAAGGDDHNTFNFGTFHSFSPRAHTAPWILNTYDTMIKKGDGMESRNEYFFNAVTGKLLRKRILANYWNPALGPAQNRAPNDLLQVFGHNNRGSLTLSQSYGGDVQNNLPTGDLSQVSLAGLTPEHQVAVDYNYAAGTVDTFIQDPASGADLLRTHHQQVELHTGLVVRREDPDGVETTFQYDEMMMEEVVRRGTDTPMVTNYLPSDGTLSHEKTVAQGDRLNAVMLDGYGRRRISETRLPNQTSYTETVYENGVVAKQSNPTFNLQNATYTQFLDLDYQGRPTRIRTADGKERTIEYVGARLARYHEGVAGDPSGNETTATKTEQYDPLGRLVSVSQQFDNGTLYATEYRYNVHDQLVEVVMGSGGSQQTRQLTYDNRKFLIAENHPELTGGGTADVVYTKYDASGRIRETVLPDKTLRFNYHYSGNPSQVLEVVGGGERLVKDFYYADTNLSTTNLTAGKLIHARRFNYLPGETEPTVVTNTYFYEDPNGRNTTIRLRTNRGEAFEQSFAYDALGLVSQWSYPAKKVGDLDPGTTALLFGPEAQRTISFNYNRGFLVNIPAVLTGIDYHPHQSFYATIHHRNGVSDSIDTAANGIPRPHRIRSTIGGETIWDSGLYAYDTAGNVAGIGGDRFTYDRSSRLASATVSGLTETYTYDLFGNLTHIDGAAIGIDPATNRLSGAQYDNRGNLTQFQGVAYNYDALSKITSVSEGDTAERFLYDAMDHRVATLDPSGPQHWTIRDQTGMVVKEYKSETEQQQLRKLREYVHAGDRLLAAFYTIYEEDGTETTVRRHYNTDHLGTPRLITDEDGEEVSRHDYLPFGPELTVGQGDPDPERLKFTGQERDRENRDYFKARYYLPFEGRFFSPDPVLGKAENPNSWNRYAYALNNPLKFNDPTGEEFGWVIPSFSNALSEWMLIDPILYFQVDMLDQADQALAAFNVKLEDLAVEYVGENDTMAFLIVSAEVLTPDGVAEAVWEVGVDLVTGKAGSTLFKGIKGVGETSLKYADDILDPKAWKAADGKPFSWSHFREGMSEGARAEVIGATENIVASGKKGMANLPDWSYAGTQRGFFASLFGRGFVDDAVEILPGRRITHQEEFIYSLGQLIGGRYFIGFSQRLREMRLEEE